MSKDDSDNFATGALFLGAGAAALALGQWIVSRSSPEPESTPAAPIATSPSTVARLAPVTARDARVPRNARARRGRSPTHRARPRGAAGSHKDVEFAVTDTRGEDHYFKTFDEAITFAGNLALTTTVRIELDVVVHSRAGAVWWWGPDGGTAYDEDPDASVFDRLHVKVTSTGRVP